MAYTISTQFGHEVQERHNYDKEFRNTESNVINKKGGFEIWEFVPIQEKYHELFDEAVAEYNKKIDVKRHPRRVIKSYYEKIQKDKQKHVAYELITEVGNRDNHPDKGLCKKILHDYIYGNLELGVLPWSVRNPNLIMTGCVYHADEKGWVHCHTDYIPVAHNFKRGMHTQTNYKNALKEQGTNISSFRQAENELLQHICEEYGLEIEHPQAGKNSVHKSTAYYKALKEIEDMENYARRVRKMAEQTMDKAKECEKKVKRKNLELLRREKSVNLKEKYWNKQRQEIKQSKEELEDSQAAFQTLLDRLSGKPAGTIADAEMALQMRLLEEQIEMEESIRKEYEEQYARLREKCLVPWQVDSVTKKVTKWMRGNDAMKIWEQQRAERLQQRYGTAGPEAPAAQNAGYGYGE